MTDPATLLALADRCEQAAGPDRELDQDITKLLVPNNATHIYRSRRGWSFFVYDSGKGIEWFENQPYTVSLDAAVTLVPEGWRWWVNSSPFGRCWLVANDQIADKAQSEKCATPALALCAAALRAKAAAYE
jgi:hypothetical protein